MVMRTDTQQTKNILIETLRQGEHALHAMFRASLRAQGRGTQDGNRKDAMVSRTSRAPFLATKKQDDHRRRASALDERNRGTRSVSQAVRAKRVRPFHIKRSAYAERT